MSGTLFTGCAEKGANSAASLPELYDYRASSIDELRGSFENPPQEAGPWVYWFWWDNVLNRENITRELEEMAHANVAGVEMRSVSMFGFGGGSPGPMYSPEGWAQLDHQRYEYLSPEFVDMLEHTLSEAERLGLRFAINLGMGWPPGGPWITDEYRSKHLVSERRIVEGPLELTGDVEVRVETGTLIHAWRVTGSEEVDPQSYIDLSENIGADGLLRWEVPSGKWLLGIFSMIPGGRVDKGYGGEVDPASQKAVLHHLNHMFDRLDPKLSRFYGSTFTDAATDSWEYARSREGRYWSTALWEESQKVLGYNIKERMYALLDYGPDEENIHEDLERLEKTLVHENYFQTVENFLHKRGIRHRPQIYGRGLERDLMDAYAIVDIPEIEEGKYVQEAIWTSRLLDKPITSVEAFTFISVQGGNLFYDYDGQKGRMSNVREEQMWQATPEKIYRLSNAHFARGINRIHYHSFSYSPPGIPEPGWRMYAEIWLNRNVSWWDEWPELNRKIARSQFALQSGEPITETLVYPVRSNPSDGPYNVVAGQPNSAIDAIDGANIQILSLLLEQGVAIADRIRNVALIEDVSSIAEATLLAELIDKGIPIWCSTALPEQWTVFENVESDSETVTLRKRFAEGRSSNLIRDARGQSWDSIAERNRSVSWEPESAKLSYQLRRFGETEIYYISSWEDGFEGRIQFKSSAKPIEVWDASTGRIEKVEPLETANGDWILRMDMDRNDSRWVVLEE